MTLNHRRWASVLGRPASAGVACLLLLLALAAAALGHAAPQFAPAARRLLAPAGGPLAQSGSAGPVVHVPGGLPLQGAEDAHDTSPALRTLAGLALATDPRTVAARPEVPLAPLGHRDVPDALVQRALHPAGAGGAAPGLDAAWNGLAADGYLPLDANGAPGLADYLQVANGAFAVWDKLGHRLYGPTPLTTLWQGFPGLCASGNTADPIVLYDRAADRWLIGQVTTVQPYQVCMAVSATPDPLGAWARYAFSTSGADLPDYPKWAVWPDGYYMSANLPSGAHPVVFDRAAMLAGRPASFQAPAASGYQQMLPATLASGDAPPAGSPALFLESDAALDLYRFHVDWADPGQTTFQPAATLGPAPFTLLCPTTFDCLAQPSSSQRLEGLGGYLMASLTYRLDGGRETLLANSSVDVGGGQAGVRWYEIGAPETAPTILQQGSYAPDGDSRWMASTAMDRLGDIALGYSVVGPATFPSLRYAGQLAGDPPGTLPQGEGVLVAGTGVQEGGNRWGDYSSMQIDPADDCTFWYTGEYNNSGGLQMQTRIGAFHFPGCPAAAPPTPRPTVTPPPVASPTATPPAPACTVAFSDVHAADYFALAVGVLACQGAVSGYGDGTFRPYQPATRGQLVKIVVRGLGLALAPPPDGRATFADVPAGSPFWAVVETAAATGAVGGYSCGGPAEPCDPTQRPYFRPNAGVTRAQLAKIAVAASGWLPSRPAVATFADVAVGSGFYPFVETAACHGAVSGYACGGPGEPCDPSRRPYFRPTAGATRGQIARIVYGVRSGGAACAAAAPTP